ncbi:MAG: hypothetical protein ACOYB1_11705 [Limnohabitans sp.]
MNVVYKLIGLMLVFLGQTACQAPLALIPERSIETKRLTLGDVQANIKVGVSRSQVIEKMGSPNIVSGNSSGIETWVYDKFSTDAEYSNGFSSGVSSKSARTMMVVIDFDASGVATSVKYRQTSY